LAAHSAFFAGKIKERAAPRGRCGASESQLPVRLPLSAVAAGLALFAADLSAAAGLSHSRAPFTNVFGAGNVSSRRPSV
jgi:hypothetical protein